MPDVMRLPAPLEANWEWQLQGACRVENPDVFFHPEGERGSARRRRDESAQRVCLGCPVLEECRAHALSVREPYGVWGALTEDDRTSIYLHGSGLVG